MSDPRLDSLLARLEAALRSDEPLERLRAEVEATRSRALPASESQGHPALPPLEREPTLEEAARFVHEVLLRPHARDGRFVVAPLVPVVGLPRSGRTSFLAGLGLEFAALREQRSGPYEGRFALEPFSLESVAATVGGDAAHASALAPWIADQGGDARSVVDGFLRRGSFPPPTKHHQGARYLVAPLRRDGAPLARLVTVESPGEAVRRVFRAGASPDPLAAFRLLGDDSPEGVCAQSLDRATGIVLLVDSTRPTDERAAAHEPFFRLLARGLAARARDALGVLATQLAEEERTGERATLEAAVFRIRRTHRRTGEELCLELEGPLLEALASALEPGDSEQPPTRGDLRRLLRDLVAVPDERTLVQAIGARLAQGLARPERRGSRPDGGPLDAWTRAAARLRGVSLDAARHLASAPGPAREGLFPRLRGLSVVETRTDVGAPVSPFAWPSCGPELEAVQGALRVLGGDVRCYEASVTGSASLVGARFVPGPWETQARLQVLEPVFDLLGVPRADPGV